MKISQAIVDSGFVEKLRLAYKRRYIKGEKRMKKYHAHVYKTVGMTEITVEAKTENEAYEKVISIVKEDLDREFVQPDYEHVARLFSSYTDEEEEEERDAIS